MVQHILRELLGLCIGQILTQPGGVQAGFVHADKADGGEVIVEASEIMLGVGIQSLVQQLGNDGPLGF